MKYINSKLSKYMSDRSPSVAIDSHPRLSGINDTINATFAHGPKTRLPGEFYDGKVRDNIDMIVMDEWFRGYEEDVEVRKLGIGAQLGDVTDRMVQTSLNGGWKPDVNRNDTNVKMALSGCHDTTLTSMLLSLGIRGERWPPFSASLVFELFKKKDVDSKREEKKGLLSSLFSSGSNSPPSVRGPITNPADLEELNNHYVRIRYNDKVMLMPGCAASGKHLPGDESFCTLKAFKEIVDKFTPESWKDECYQNMDQGIYAQGNHKAGY